MNQYSPGGFFSLPPVVKNILIINIILFLATYILQRTGINLNDYLAIYSIKSSHFQPYQLITHMFMHGSIAHIFFNMFALWMFGRVLEDIWGPKRFFIYYFVTGLGAAFLHLLVNYIEITMLINKMDPVAVDVVLSQGADLLQGGQNYADTLMGKLNLMINIPTVGASGAIFGLLLAFGVMFPNAIIYIFFALPLKAKYFVMIYGGLELYLGFANRAGDNVAHFAHLGGMLFGLIFLLIWKKHRFNRWN
ncbi:MAG TPA: rhomboid family intramembrane serine protease [Bacteroidales bacterium]|nr:rhomboid family intramembrane serine protease [Bacteroidales bacterium]